MKIELSQLNAGTGMALGSIIAATIALLVQIITGETAIWIWAIPVGIAAGLATGAGARRKVSNRDQRRIGNPESSTGNADDN